MKQDLWQKFITHIILFYSPWPGYINGTVKPKIYYEYETSLSFASSHIYSQKKKRLFARRKIQLNSEMFYFIWKASFLQEHNNDLLIYKVLYFRGSQNAFL